MSETRAYLDDVREMPEGFNVLWRSRDEALEWMTKYGCPDFISFDHDLGIEFVPYPRETTGMDVVKWMVNEDMGHNEFGSGFFIPNNFDYAVHSANPVGARNIASYLCGYLNHKAGI
jgi:hypothetical protein